jgi:uncharacterized protein with HEPN domain
MQPDDAYLLDMLHEARTAVEFVGKKTYEEFEQDTQCRYAVIRAIEVLGEAAAQVSDEFRLAHPDIEWRKIVGMRNRLIHGYGDIVLSIVWEVLQTDIPELIELLEPLAPSAEDSTT